MSDDRLFASNNAIGRKWYVINIVLLAVITAVTKYVLCTYIIPYTTSELFKIISKGLLWLFYGGYMITFFSLIDRRLFDVFGTRDAKGYRNISAIIGFAIFWQIFTIYCLVKKPPIPLPMDIIVLVAIILDVVFFSIVITIAFMKGQISDLSYEEYRNKIKYM